MSQDNRFIHDLCALLSIGNPEAEDPTGGMDDHDLRLLTLYSLMFAAANNDHYCLALQESLSPKARLVGTKEIQEQYHKLFYTLKREDTASALHRDTILHMIRTMSRGLVLKNHYLSVLQEALAGVPNTPGRSWTVVGHDPIVSYKYLQIQFGHRDSSCKIRVGWNVLLDPETGDVLFSLHIRPDELDRLSTENLLHLFADDGWFCEGNPSRIENGNYMLTAYRVVEPGELDLLPLLQRTETPLTNGGTEMHVGYSMPPYTDEDGLRAICEAVYNWLMSFSGTRGQMPAMLHMSAVGKYSPKQSDN